MGLGVPLALLGLALASVPVLAHLVRRSDVPTRTLPTVALLARAVAESRRRVRISDPWLLAVRIALVCTLAIAVAAPFVERASAYGGGTTASVAIVVDDSMSMARSDAGRSLFDAARQRASDIVDALPEGSEVALVLAGAPARVIVPRTSDREAARRALEALPAPGARATDLDAAVQAAGRQLAGAVHADRSVVLLSDLARPSTAAPLEAGPGVRLQLEPLGPPTMPNLTVAAADATPDPTVPGSLSIAVTVRAFDASTERATVAIVHAGRELARAEVALADGVGRATLHALPPDDGDPSGEVRLVDAGDALPLDDARGVLFRASSAIRVLLVDGDPRPLVRHAVASGGASTRYVAQALALAPHDGPGFAVRRVDVDTFVRGGDAADVAFLADVDIARSDVAARVRALSESGAGVLVAGGDHVRASAALAEILPARISGASDAAHVGLVAGPAALPSRGTGLDRVATHRALALDASQSSFVALSFDDGSPALVLDRAHRSAVLALPLDDTQSDLPLHPGFLALAVEIGRVLAPPGTMPDAPFAPGSVAHLPVAAETTRVEIVGPDGGITAFEGSALAHGASLEALTAPGPYRVRVTTPAGTREEPRMAFVLGAPLDESRLARAELPTEPESSVAASARTTVQARLAPWLFALAGLLALAEAWLRRPPPRAIARA